MKFDLRRARNKIVVFTVDYEIFGKGDGDVKRHIIEPMEKMGLLANEFGFPIVVFVEVEEYVAFCSNSDKLQKTLGYDPAELMRSQLRWLVECGHELQLHIHPEWFGAEYEDCRWKLTPEHTSVDTLFSTQEEVTGYIAERKKILDNIIQEVNPNGRVTAFRAGAFCAQPGKMLIKALGDNGISVDSSVVKGMKRKTPSGHMIDYSDAKENPGYWLIEDNVAVNSATGRVWEIPITSIMGRRWNQISITRILAKFSKKIPKKQREYFVSELKLSKNPLKFLTFLLSPTPIKLDYHNQSVAQMVKMMKRVSGAEKNRYSINVMIGHTKEHRDTNILNELFKRISEDQSFTVSTFSKIVETFESEGEKA